MAEGEYEFYIYTDGSGKGDSVHAGGYAANILSLQHSDLNYTSVVGGGSCMSTTRAELTAILEGLQRVYVYFEGIGKTLSIKAKRKPTILIVSDREDLVGVINSVYSSSKHGDLWARYAWYASIFDIEAKWIKRETNVMHKLSDRLSSGFRLVVADYITAQESVDHIAKT